MSQPPGLLERSSPLPLYHQLRRFLVGRIESGEWRPGDLVPGDLELASRFGVSRTTVRLAFRELELAGLVTRTRGRGTFVARPKLTHGPDARHHLTDSLREQGLRPGWRLLECRDVGAPDDVAAALGVGAGTPLCRVARVRLAGGEAIGHHVAHAVGLRAAVLSHGALGAGDSLDYLVPEAERAWLRIERIIEAVPAAEPQVSLLRVDAGAALLRVRRLVCDAGGAPREHLSASYRGDRFQYLTRSAPGA